MSGSGRKRPTLVADKRYPGKRAKSARPKTKTAPKRKSTPKRAARGPIGALMSVIGRVLGFCLGLIWKFSWRLGLAIILIIGGAVAYTAMTLPPMDEIVDGRTRGSVTLMDRNGEVFAWRGDQFGGVVTAETVSSHLHNAIVATEDKRFYWHFGIDFYATGAAMVRNYRTGGNPLDGAGGSSITQQTAKLLCYGQPFDSETWESERAYEADCRRTTLWRKAREAVYAMAMEAVYTKEEILTIYLNRAYLGAGSRGFEAAAQRYFGKSAAEVTPAEAAMLAGLLKAPTTYAPTNSIERSRDRASVVIGLMEDQGYLSASAAEEARTNPARLSQAAEARAGGYFADWVMDQGPDFFTRDTTEDVVILTTLDQRIQTAAEEAMIHIFETKVSEGSRAQAAIVVMSPDGAVRAMVGGRDIRASGAFNRATQALRQTGSSFKPFVYGTALELGMSPNDVVVDEEFCMTVPGSGQWCPKNYSNEFRGPVTLSEALTHSLNIPAVKVSEQAGRDNVRTVASQFGIENDLDAGPALALGTSESTLLEMTGAYAGILNGGSAVAPYGLVELRLVSDDAPLMSATGGIRERVIREDAARQLVWMMHQVVEDGTGRRARIDGVQIAGKTGTTQSARDAWFIAFTGDYVTGVWMGNDDNAPLRDTTGGTLPADIWRETMVRVMEGGGASPLPMQSPDPYQDEAQELIDQLLLELQAGN